MTIDSDATVAFYDKKGFGSMVIQRKGNVTLKSGTVRLRSPSGSDMTLFMNNAEDLGINDKLYWTTDCQFQIQDG